MLEQLRNQHGNIYKAILFILCVSTLVFLLPKDSRQVFDFNVDEPWHYGDLFTPFDYAIQKSDAQLTAEKDSVRAQTRPYYQLNDGVLPAQEKELEGLIQENWSDCKYSVNLDGLSFNNIFNKDKSAEKDSLAQLRHVELAMAILEELYATGIIRLDVLHEEQPKDYSITLLGNNRVLHEDIELKELYSIKSASAYAEDELEKANKVDVLFLLDLIEDCLEHNVFYDEEKTLYAQEEKVGGLSLTGEVVLAGEKVIARGDKITEKKYQRLISFFAKEKQLRGEEDEEVVIKDYYFLLAGQVLLVSLCMLALLFYLVQFRKDVLRHHPTLLFVLLLIVFMTFLTKLALDMELIEVYLVPMCLLPVMIRAFYDARLALFVHIFSIVMASFIVPNQFEFIFLHLIAGSAVLFSIASLRKRAQFFAAVLIVFISYSLSYFGLTFILDGNVENINWNNFAWFGGSAFLALFAAYPLIYLVEKVFGFISEITMIELSDTNSPLLRELASKAPGTFQHSLQVANLAEDAIHEIGGNALLVRTGALYHDIGKMNAPMYFIENQSGINPHNELGYEESAEIIIKHVLDGIEMAKKNNLPDQIIDFIRTHHGTTRTEYFYRMSVKEAVEGELVDADKYTYPGPLPYSKETAVLMMADSVEAASKSLKEYTAMAIDGLVENIIEHQIKAKQFINADITLKDITTIKKMFKRKLMNIHHVRIEYPT